MIELTVSIQDKHDGMISVPFFLSTWAATTPDNAKPIMSTWSCSSPYLGRGFNGNYYVKKEYDFNNWHDDETTGLKIPHQSLNALFFDFGQDRPFLRLRSFNFTSARELKLMGDLLQGKIPTLAETVFWWIP